MNERRCPECNAAFVPRYSQQVCCGEKNSALFSGPANPAVTFSGMGSAGISSRSPESPSSAARRKAFFAARDAAFERAGLPIPRIVERDGMRIEYRGRGFGSIA